MSILRAEKDVFQPEDLLEELKMRTAGRRRALTKDEIAGAKAAREIHKADC